MTTFQFQCHKIPAALAVNDTNKSVAFEKIGNPNQTFIDYHEGGCFIWETSCILVDGKDEWLYNNWYRVDEMPENVKAYFKHILEPYANTQFY